VITLVLGDQVRIIFEIQREAEATFQFNLLAETVLGLDL
jgi:hypothetical protein